MSDAPAATNWSPKPGDGHLHLARVRKGATDAEHEVVEWVQNPSVASGLLEKEVTGDVLSWKPVGMLTMEEYAARIKHISQEYPDMLDHINALIRSHERLEQAFAKSEFLGALEPGEQLTYERLRNQMHGVHAYLKNTALSAKRTYVLVTAGDSGDNRTLGEIAEEHEVHHIRDTLAPVPKRQKSRAAAEA